jgi:hypothetical protein
MFDMFMEVNNRASRRIAGTPQDHFMKALPRANTELGAVTLMG